MHCKISAQYHSVPEWYSDHVPTTVPVVTRVLGLGVPAVVQDLSPIVFPTESCPPLRSRSLDVQCRAPGQREAGSCDGPQQAGTVASFKCKPLHQHHALPPSAYSSRCGEDGSWSVRLFTCTPVCGRPTGKGTAFVRNGQNVSSSADFPWHVAVYDKKPADPRAGAADSPQQICAAHCFYTQRGAPRLRNVSEFAVALGKRLRSWDKTEDTEQRRTIERILTSGYGDRKLLYVNDIALVELQQDVVGWGGDRDKPREALQYAKLPFVEEAACKKNVTEKFVVYTVLEDKFCVGTANGASVGPGDSGGGIAFATPERQWFLKGVASVGDANAVAISLFTNVSQFISWMSSVTNDGLCGEFNPRKEPTAVGEHNEGHMPWTVRVRVDDGEGSYRELSGALVQPNVVLTCECVAAVRVADERRCGIAKRFVTFGDRVLRRAEWVATVADGMRLLSADATPYAGNDTGTVQTIAPSAVHVTWAAGDGSRLRSDVSIPDM
ncbi:hypothetical protein ONE63_004984 [Megalurothrips usitatus]|uniref:Uncharacterized protein n=1 Tax=Megalurothrips usitatus TaxID=439358 RepID=A0AAV7X7X8_9NEOP|nr:hypothetical protein ONE63_004984 [Megalurothrips usitatus]